MKKRVFFIAAAAALLFLLAGCVMPDVPGEEPPAGSLTYDEMIANLGVLQGPVTASATEAGRSIFVLEGGASLSIGDLVAYIDAIKNQFAAYVKASAGGSTYIVSSVKMSLPGGAIASVGL